MLLALLPIVPGAVGRHMHLVHHTMLDSFSAKLFHFDNQKSPFSDGHFCYLSACMLPQIYSSGS